MLCLAYDGVERDRAPAVEMLETDLLNTPVSLQTWLFQV